MLVTLQVKCLKLLITWLHLLANVKANVFNYTCTIWANPLYHVEEDNEDDHDVDIFETWGFVSSFDAKAHVIF